jgi:hypothetical protein
LRSHQFSNTDALPVRTAQTFGGLFRWPCAEITAGRQSARSQSTHCYRRGDLSGARGGWCAFTCRECAAVPQPIPGASARSAPWLSSS